MEQLNQVIRVLKTPVTLILLLMLVAGAGYWGLKAASAPIVRSADQCVMTDVGKELTPRFVSVRMLNAGANGGAAKTAASYVRAFGFNVIRVNNADSQVTKTTIVGNAADSPEVRLVQQFFPDSITEGDGRTDHVVDVLIGQGWAQATAPVTSVSVKGPVCLPTRSTASASPSSVTPSVSPSASASPSKKK